MSAGRLACAVAAARFAVGSSLLDGLDELAVRFGVHATAQRSYRREGVGGIEAIAAIVERLRTDPPAALGGLEVSVVDDLAAGGQGLAAAEGGGLRCGPAGRVVGRPSGAG